MINKRTRMGLACLTAGLLVGTAFIGCGGASSTLANPAAEKCVRDGFVLEPVVIDGVVREYRCVNPHTGRKCDAWDYYRGRCTLGEPSKPQKSKKE